MSVPYFITDDQPLLLPAGAQKVFDGGNWALYHCKPLYASFLVTRMSGGWRIRHLAGIVNLQWADNFVQTVCGGCIGKE